MSDNIHAGMFAGIAFFLIGCTTWFFSSRRSSFIRTFARTSASRSDLRQVVRQLPPDNDFGQGMRAIGGLQMALGLVIFLVSLGAWLLR